jgi:hypothetical protein
MKASDTERGGTLGYRGGLTIVLFNSRMMTDRFRTPVDNPGDRPVY